MANPKGNIATLKPFKPKGKKPLKGHLAVKIDADTLSAVKALPNWQEKVRDAINKLIEEEAVEKEGKSKNAA